MLLSKLLSVTAIAVFVLATSDSDISHSRSKRTIGVVLRNVGDLFGFDVFRRPAVGVPVPAPASTLTDNVRKSFTININWNKNRTQGNSPGGTPAAASGPAASAPASGRRPAAAPAAAPAPAPAAAPALPPTRAPGPTVAPTLPTRPPAPQPVPATAGLTTPAPVIPKPSGPPTKAQLYVEYLDNNRNKAEDEEEVDDDADSPKRIQIGLPDYSSVDYNEVKRDLVNQGNNDFDHSKEKFKQEFNNFWEASPWSAEQGYKFIVPQEPRVNEAAKAGSKLDLPKRSLKIVHNVKVYHQPTKMETYSDFDPQTYLNTDNPQHQLHIVDEEGVRYIVHQNGKKLPLPTNINAHLLEYYKKKFQADAAAQRNAVIEGEQNAIQSNEDLTTSTPIIYKGPHIPIHHVSPEVIKEHIENIQKIKSNSITPPETKEQHHIFKVNHYHNSETPYSNNNDGQPETIHEPEYLKIKKIVEKDPPADYVNLHTNDDLNSYIANARPGQIVQIKIVEPSQREHFEINRDRYKNSAGIQKNIDKEQGQNKNPIYDFKEYEKIDYPSYNERKNYFHHDFTDERNKNLEDNYHFFNLDNGSRGRDKLNTKGKKEKTDEIKGNDVKIEKSTNIENKDKKGTDEGDEAEDDNNETKTHSRNIQITNTRNERKDKYIADGDEEHESEFQRLQKKHVTKIKTEENVEDDDENKNSPQKIQEDKKGNIDTYDYCHQQHYGKTTEDDNYEELPLIRKENMQRDIDEDDEDEFFIGSIQRETDEDHKENKDRPLTEKENLTEEEDNVENDGDNAEGGKRLKSIEEEEINEYKDDVEEQPKPLKTQTANEEHEEVEDEAGSKLEKVNENEEDDDEEIENNDEESKQHLEILYNNNKEKFDLGNFEEFNKPKKTEFIRQHTPSRKDNDILSELNNFIDAHLQNAKDIKNINEDAGQDVKDRLKSIQKVHETEFDNLFSKLEDGMEYEDFYKKFNRENKFIPSKQNLIDSEIKHFRSKDKADISQQFDSTLVQPLYSGVLHAPTEPELFTSDKPLAVPFDHDYSSSETKTHSIEPRHKRSIDYADDKESTINEFKEETLYVPDRYSLDYSYETPEPKLPDFQKLEAKQYKDDDILSPNAYVTSAEDGQKTTWIKIKVPVTYITQSRTRK